MKRVFAPVLAAALLTGCGGETAPLHDNLPKSLPTAVARELGAAAYLEFIKEPDEGSAIRIKFGPGNFFLSAGHLITDGNDRPKSGSQECGTIQLQASSKAPDIPDKVGNHTLRLFGTTLVVTASAASYVAGDTGPTPDIALLKANVTSGSLPDTELPEIAKTKAKIGSDVFFVNYEPVTDSLLRDPNQLLIPPGLDPNLYDKPAIYGGIVTNYLQNGDYIVTDGIRSYGAISQTTSRRGASGGAVLNDTGELIGVAIETSANNAPAQRPYTIVQPVTEQLVENLSKELVSLQCPS